MNYVEFLRLRRSIAWYAGVLGALTLIGMISLNFHAKELRLGASSSLHGSLDFSALFGVAVATSLIFATIIASSLNRENGTPEMIRTKPFSLERVAISFFAADLAAIGVAFAIAVAYCLIAISDAGLVLGVFPPPIEASPGSALIAVLGLGVAFMWYGLLQAASAGLRGRGGIIVGLSWAVFPILGSLVHAPLPQAIHDLIVAVNVLNPLAYMNSITSHGSSLGASVPNSVFALDPWLRAGMAWLLGVAACATAIFTWKRLEI